MVDRRPLVMIVNDDAAVLDALQFVLQLEGLEVQLHNNGMQLLENRDLPHADCLILKDRMPGMDGFELLRSLPARQVYAPALLLTREASPALRARAHTAGVKVVLEMPILDNALVEAVLDALPSPE